MSLLNTTLQTLVVRLRDMTGGVTQQKLHNRIFDAYEAKSLVFEAITPAQFTVMQKYNGIIPPMHPVGQPLLIDSWADLMSVHKDEYYYQLMPRRARNNESYNVLRAICSSAGSPFTMEDRVEPIDYKLSCRGHELEVRNEFNAKNADKAPQMIWFDGILKGRTGSALLSFHNALSTAHVGGIVGSEQFLRHWCAIAPEADRYRMMKEMYADLLARPTMLFLGTNALPSRELLNYARTKSVFIYTRRGMVFEYCQMNTEPINEDDAVGCFLEATLVNDTTVEGTIFTYNPKEGLIVLLRCISEGQPSMTIVRTPYIKEYSLKPRPPKEHELPPQLEDMTLPSMHAGRDKSIFKHASVQIKHAESERRRHLENMQPQTPIAACDAFVKVARLYPDISWVNEEGVIRVTNDVVIVGDPDWNSPKGILLEGAPEKERSMVERVQKALNVGKKK